MDVNGNEIVWYTAMDDEVALATGNQLEVTVDSDTTLYIASRGEGARMNVGATNLAANAGAIHPGGFNLIFDANQAFNLDAFWVKAEGSKDRDLVLLDSLGNELYRETIFIEDGVQKVNVDLPVPLGQGLQIGFEAGADLFRSSEGVAYPYEIEEVLSINSSSANGNASSDFYYYLFNWEISTNTSCESERVAVNGTVDICTSTGNLEELSFNVYPNPFGDVVHLAIPYNHVQLNVYESQGKKVDTKYFSSGNQSYQANHLNPGVYLFELITAESIKTYTLIKQ